MAPKKLPKGQKATHPVLVRKAQHRDIHSLAKKEKICVADLVDVMIKQAKIFYEVRF